MSAEAIISVVCLSVIGLVWLAYCAGYENGRL